MNNKELEFKKEFQEIVNRCSIEIKNKWVKDNNIFFPILNQIIIPSNIQDDFDKETKQLFITLLNKYDLIIAESAL